MKKVGITGQTGFIGTHLFNTLGLQPASFQRVNFNKSFFAESALLDSFIEECDVVVHLAGMNRHNDPEIVYQTNIDLINKLINSLNRTRRKIHIIFASSTQEEGESRYGKSKKEGRELLSNWAISNGGKFTGLIIPNVFGPFGNPYYNSVIATFCYQLTHMETPEIQIDGELKLIYVDELVREIINLIREERVAFSRKIQHTYEIKVSKVLEFLQVFKMDYLEKGIVPVLNDTFQVNLFNTFRCYMDIKSRYPVKFTEHADNRGTFVEIIRLNVGGQVSFSTTVPGVTRGDHFHTRKIERFAVIKGEARIQLRRIGTSDTMEFYLSGNEPAYVDMPIWHAHNIKNVGKEELYTIFWINEFFNSEDPDTYSEIV